MPNQSPEPTAAGLCVWGRHGRFAAPWFRRDPVSGGCSSARRSPPKAAANGADQPRAFLHRSGVTLLDIDTFPYSPVHRRALRFSFSTAKAECLKYDLPV